jgi:hypothetical protein
MWLQSALLLCCGFPTDQSSQVFVTLEVPTRVVVRGQSVILRGLVWQQTSEGSPVKLTAASLSWTSDKPALASLVRQEDGSAVLTGINSGLVRVTAAPRDYEDAHAATIEIRISNTVEIDSVRPRTVRYGGQITIYGVGLGQIAQAALGETSLIPDPAGFSGDPNGAGEQRFWVPFPAATSRVLATATAGFSAPAAEVTEVIPRTVFFTSDGSPAVVRLNNTDTSGRTLFENPALAITPEGGGNLFHLLPADTTRPVTIIVSTNTQVVTSIVPSLSPLLPAGVETYWNIGAATQQCGGSVVRTAPGLDFATRPVTLARSLQRTPGEGILLRVDGASPGRFALKVVEGFLGVDSRIKPDRFEENDFCTAADSNSVLPTKAIDLTSGLSDMLTIDQGYEVDWFRFSVPEDPEHPGDPTPLLVTARTLSRPFAAGDSSNLGLEFGRVDDLRFGGNPDGSVVPWLAESHEVGPAERLSSELPPGDYYLVVSDEAGVPTRYALCLAVGNDCDLPVPAASVR